jgi:hypothetical protein
LKILVLQQEMAKGQKGSDKLTAASINDFIQNTVRCLKVISLRSMSYRWILLILILSSS